MMTEEEWKKLEELAFGAKVALFGILERKDPVRPFAYLTNKSVSETLIAAHRELKQRREDEAWLFPASPDDRITLLYYGKPEVWVHVPQGDRWSVSPTLHEAIEKARGGKG